jgi:hypothetical protein
MIQVLRSGESFRVAHGQEFRVLELLEHTTEHQLYLLRPPHEQSLRCLGKLQTRALATASSAEERSWQREHQLLLRIGQQQVPQLLPVQSAGTTADGVTYLISSPVDGELLSEYLLRRGPVPEAEALALVLQVGEALIGVSQAGAFLPACSTRSIFVERADKDRAPQVKLCPIGAVALPSPYLTVQPHTLDPQTAALDPTQDQVALALLLIELVTGQPVYTVATDVKTTELQLRSLLPRLQTLPLASAVSEVLVRALSAERFERFPSIQLLVKALRDASLPRVLPSDSAVAVMTSSSVVEPLRLPGLWSYLLLAVVTTASGIGGYFLSLSGESADESTAPVEVALDLLPPPRPPAPDLAIAASSPSLLLSSAAPDLAPAAIPTAIPTGTPAAIPTGTPAAIPTGTPLTVPSAPPIATPEVAASDPFAERPPQVVIDWKVSSQPSSLPASIAARWRSSLKSCFASQIRSAPNKCKVTLMFSWADRRFYLTNPECSRSLSSELRRAMEDCANRELAKQGTIGPTPESVGVVISQRVIR